MYRTKTFGLLSRRLIKSISAFVSSDASTSLPNPCIAMGPDSNHIVCYHPEKPHPYELTRPIDRSDPSLAQNDSVFNSSVQLDFNERYDTKEMTKRDFRLETDKLAQVFNEHPALFRKTPKLDKIRRAPQFPNPKPDRSGI